MSNPIISPLPKGKKNEPLPDSEMVMRLLKLLSTTDSKVAPNEFELSTADELSELKSISVWAERLTSSEQAREFMGEKKLAYTHYCSLNVAQIRAIRPDPENEEIISLNVVWDPLTEASEHAKQSANNIPGIDGHSGIIGLMRIRGLPRLHFFNLRSQLADLASKTLKRIL